MPKLGSAEREDSWSELTGKLCNHKAILASFTHIKFCFERHHYSATIGMLISYTSSLAICIIIYYLADRYRSKVSPQ